MNFFLSLFAALLLSASPYLNIPVASIQPLQMLREGVPATICTTFSINEQAKMWGTAAHCVLEEQSEELGQGGPVGTRATLIGGKPTVVVFVNQLMDVAVLKAEVSAPAIPIGKRPAVGDVVRVYGYMWGAHSPTIFKGEIANLNAGARGDAYMIFDMRVGGGHSGSPILDVSGQVVSVMQISSMGFSGGALYGYLDAMQPYWSAVP